MNKEQKVESTSVSPADTKPHVSGWRLVEVLLRLKNGKIATYKTQMLHENKNDAIQLAKRQSWSDEVVEVIHVSFYACR